MFTVTTVHVSVWRRVYGHFYKLACEAHALLENPQLAYIWCTQDSQAHSSSTCTCRNARRLCSFSLAIALWCSLSAFRSAHSHQLHLKSPEHHDGRQLAPLLTCKRKTTVTPDTREPLTQAETQHRSALMGRRLVTNADSVLPVGSQQRMYVASIRGE